MNDECYECPFCLARIDFDWTDGRTHLLDTLDRLIKHIVHHDRRCPCDPPIEYPFEQYWLNHIRVLRTYHIDLREHVEFYMLGRKP